MDADEYQKLALRTLNSDLDKEKVLLNGAMGLCGESGEFIDALKKHMMHGHELDRDHMIKELGDVAWYLAISAHALDCDLSEVFTRNIDKLKARYPEGFSEERSRHRAKNDD